MTAGRVLTVGDLVPGDVFINVTPFDIGRLEAMPVLVVSVLIDSQIGYVTVRGLIAWQGQVKGYTVAIPTGDRVTTVFPRREATPKEQK